MELVGIVLFLGDGVAVKKISQYIGVFMVAFLLIVISFVTIQINGSDQWIYHTVFISMVLNFFGAFFIYKVSSKIIDDLESLLHVIIKCVLVQCIVAVLFKVYPPFYNFIYSIIYSEGVEKNVLYGVESLYRLVGIGNAVAFAILPTSGLGMLSCAYFLIKSEGKRYYYYLLSILFISSVSFLIARTSILLSAMTLIYLLLSYLDRKQIKKTIKTLLLVSIAIGLVLSFAVIILPEDIYLWAFEMFLNVQEGGEATDTGTANLIYSMMTETHFSPRTFLIGDAMYNNPSGGYYGGADIGYYRQVLYYGLPGLFCFLLLHYLLIKKCVKKVNGSDAKRFFWFLFFNFLIILMKGDIVMTPLFIFLLVMIDFNKAPINIKRHVYK